MSHVSSSCQYIRSSRIHSISPELLPHDLFFENVQAPVLQECHIPQLAQRGLLAIHREHNVPRRVGRFRLSNQPDIDRDREVGDVSLPPR